MKYSKDDMKNPVPDGCAVEFFKCFGTLDPSLREQLMNQMPYYSLQNQIS